MQDMQVNKAVKLANHESCHPWLLTIFFWPGYTAVGSRQGMCFSLFLSLSLYLLSFSIFLNLFRFSHSPLGLFLTFSKLFHVCPFSQVLSGRLTTTAWLMLKQLRQPEKTSRTTSTPTAWFGTSHSLEHTWTPRNKWFSRFQSRSRFGRSECFQLTARK